MNVQRCQVCPLNVLTLVFKAQNLVLQIQDCLHLELRVKIQAYRLTSRIVHTLIHDDFQETLRLYQVP